MYRITLTFNDGDADMVETVDTLENVATYLAFNVVRSVEIVRL